MKDEFVFQEGKQTKLSGILISGALHIIEYDYNGNRTIISTLEPLQLFGEAYSFCNQNSICILLMKDEHNHNHQEHCTHNKNHENLNYKATYMHILADLLTSVLAIIGLLLAKYFHLAFIDSLIG